MIVYKVVLQITDKKYISCYAPDPYILYYEINKETKALPNTIGILIFINFVSVKRFIKNDDRSHLKILKCEGKGISKETIKVLGAASRLAIDDFYQSKEIIPVKAPRGTYACKSIIPKELLEI